MPDHIGGFILHELFGDAKVDQHGALALHGHNNVGRFDVAVNDRGVLVMQVGQRLDDRG